MLKGFDIAGFTAVPSVAQLSQCRHAGYEFALVGGTQQREPARSQIRALIDAGFHVEAYFFAFHDASDAGRLAVALETVKMFGLPALWIDVEWNEDLYGPTPRAARVNPSLRSLVSTIESAVLKTGIYTSRNYWPLMTGDTRDFYNLPLWHADFGAPGEYSESRLPDMASFQSYGGWAKPLIWQWAGTVFLGGLNVDKNVAETAWWQEDMMNRHSTVAPWWNDRTLQPTPVGQVDTMQALTDFGMDTLATKPRRIKFGVYLKKSNGYLRFYDGETGTEAEPVGWGASPTFGTVEVGLAQNGIVSFRVEDGNVETAVVRSLGWW